LERAGSVIREARRRAGLSQVELARRLRTSQAAVWRWESGVVEPSWSAVSRAASACGLAVAVDLQAVDPDEWRLVEWGRARSPAQRLRDLQTYSRFAVAGRAALEKAKRRG